MPYITVGKENGVVPRPFTPDTKSLPRVRTTATTSDGGMSRARSC